jgi:hypothetical protein
MAGSNHLVVVAVTKKEVTGDFRKFFRLCSQNLNNQLTPRDQILGTESKNLWESQKNYA